MDADDVVGPEPRTARNGLQVISYPLGLSSCIIRVIECGEGPRAVVLLHGTGSRADRWRRNIPGLAAAGLHVYAIDFPGHGFATKSADFEYSTPAFADVVHQMLRKLEIAEPTLVGTSMGGHVAAYLTVTSDVRVRALALVGTTGVVPVQREVTTVGRIRSTSLSGIADKLRFLLYDHSLITDAWVREESWINSSPGAAEALERTAEYVTDKADADVIGDRLARADVPIILFWGAEDKWVAPAVGHRIREELLPGAPMVLLERAGHAPYYERPDAFNAALIEFLSAPEKFGSELKTL
jgi:2-hydroxy-6-oxonona-2,4-dienedioate hydrolase